MALHSYGHVYRGRMMMEDGPPAPPPPAQPSYVPTAQESDKEWKDGLRAKYAVTIWAITT